MPRFATAAQTGEHQGAPERGDDEPGVEDRAIDLLKRANKRSIVITPQPRDAGSLDGPLSILSLTLATPRKEYQSLRTEAINGLIELHRRVARAFRNRENYRLRMLLIAGGLTGPRIP